MELEKLAYRLTVCKVRDLSGFDPEHSFWFLAKTDEELSLVCEPRNVPANADAREDGWKAFRFRGVLDFSLTGVLSGISGILSENGIALFAVSTFNTDYILIKEETSEKAEEILTKAGYRFL